MNQQYGVQQGNLRGGGETWGINFEADGRYLGKMLERNQPS